MERQIERQKNRDTDRQTDRDRDRQTERHRERDSPKPITAAIENMYLLTCLETL